MPQDITFLEVDDRLGDLGRVIGNALQISGGINKPKPSIDPLWITNDFDLELPLNGAVIKVNLTIGGDDNRARATLDCVSASKLSRICESAESARFSKGCGIGNASAMAGELLDSLRNVASQIAKPFEIAVDLEHSRDTSKVRSNRLVQRQNSHALSFDLDLPPVHRALPVFKLFGQLDPTITNRVNTLVQSIFDHRCQFEHLGPQTFHISQETAAQTLLFRCPNWNLPRFVPLTSPDF